MKTKIIQKDSEKKPKTNEGRYKIYKTVFETLTKKSKKFYDSNLIDKYKNYIKKTWDLNEIIGKSKFKIKKLPYRIVSDEK